MSLPTEQPEIPRPPGYSAPLPVRRSQIQYVAEGGEQREAPRSPDTIGRRMGDSIRQPKEAWSVDADGGAWGGIQSPRLKLHNRHRPAPIQPTRQVNGKPQLEKSPSEKSPAEKNKLDDNDLAHETQADSELLADVAKEWQTGRRASELSPRSVSLMYYGSRSKSLPCAMHVNSLASTQTKPDATYAHPYAYPVRIAAPA